MNNIRIRITDTKRAKHTNSGEHIIIAKKHSMWVPMLTIGINAQNPKLISYGPRASPEPLTQV